MYEEDLSINGSELMIVEGADSKRENGRVMCWLVFPGVRFSLQEHRESYIHGEQLSHATCGDNLARQRQTTYSYMYSYV